MWWWTVSAAVEEGAGQEQKEEEGAEVPCPLELAGLQGGGDSGTGSGPVRHREGEEVGVAS